jgi:hypothetical protein
VFLPLDDVDGLNRFLGLVFGNPYETPSPDEYAMFLAFSAGLRSCHNCAKHIIAAGLRRVVYLEPYPKSKAAAMYPQSIKLGGAAEEGSVLFEPFRGLGPRRFFDLNSRRMNRKGRHRRRIMRMVPCPSAGTVSLVDS